MISNALDARTACIDILLKKTLRHTMSVPVSVNGSGMSFEEIMRNYLCRIPTTKGNGVIGKFGIGKSTFSVFAKTHRRYSAQEQAGPPADH